MKYLNFLFCIFIKKLFPYVKKSNQFNTKSKMNLIENLNISIQKN